VHVTVGTLRPAPIVVAYLDPDRTLPVVQPWLRREMPVPNAAITCH